MEPTPIRETPDVACAKVAARRHGVITRDEALACGLTTQGIYRRAKSGLWTRVLPRTYVAGHGFSDWHQRLAALTEWAEGVASHTSAAALLKLDGFVPDALEVACTRILRPPWDNVSIHRVAQLPLDCLVINGIRTTSATRTLVDIAATVDVDRVELALEDALRRGLTSLPRLRWALSVDGCRGRRGAKALRSLVARLEDSDRITESGFEARLFQVRRRGNLPTPRRQFEIRDGRRVQARADVAYPDHRLAIEAVSYRWHSGRTAWARDQTRLNEVVAEGWRVMPVTWEDLRDAPGSVVERIRRALGQPNLGTNDDSAR